VVKTFLMVVLVAGSPARDLLPPAKPRHLTGQPGKQQLLFLLLDGLVLIIATVKISFFAVAPRTLDRFGFRSSLGQPQDLRVEAIHGCSV
jgi:hypothetical protein